MASQLVRISGSVINAKWTPAGAVAQTVTVPFVSGGSSLFAPSVHTPPAATEITVYSPSGHKGRQTVSAASGTVATGTVAPTADTLVLVFVAAAQNSGFPVDTPATAISGLGLTWTQVANQQYAFRRKLYCWWAYADTAPTPGAVTIPYEASSGTIQDVGYVVVEVGGADSEGPIGAVTATEASGATSIAATVSGTAEEGDRGFAVAGLETSATVSVEQTMINATGYTSGDNFRQLVVQWDPDDTQDASPSFSWSPADSGAAVGFLVNAGGVRPRILTPAVVAAPASVYTPSVVLANSPQSVTVDLLSDAASVHAPTVWAPSGDYPDASNTGYSGSLTEQYGYITTSYDGQVIENMWLRGGVVVLHDDVIIRNCLISDSSWLGHPERQEVEIIQDGATGLLVEDCEIDGTGRTLSTACIGFGNYTMRRCHMHDLGEGMTANGNCTIEDNFYTDAVDFVQFGAHQDGIQCESGGNMTIRHNTIIMQVDGANGNIHFSGNPHPNSLVEDNLLASRGGKDLSIGADVVCRNNKISVLLAGYDTAFPNAPSSGPYVHVFNYGLGGTSCGTTYYDSNPSAWNSPTEGDYVERSTAPTYDSAC